MTRATSHPNFRLGPIWLVGMLVTLLVATRAGAAISSGPTAKNPYEEKKRLDMNSFEAKQSNEEKLRVGQERYNQSQTNRAKIIAGMTAQFQARQQVVVVQPPTEPAATPSPPIKGLKPLLALVILAAGFFGFGYYLYSHRELEPAAPKPKRTE